MDRLEQRAERTGALITGAILLGPLCAISVYASPVSGGAGTLLGALVFGGTIRRIKADWLKVMLILVPLFAGVTFPAFGLGFVGGMILGTGGDMLRASLTSSSSASQ